MLVVPLIERKRDGGALTPEECRRWSPRTPQTASPTTRCRPLLLAVLLPGLERQELAAFTDAMLASGQRLASTRGRRPGSKHSTGGVGDKSRSCWRRSWPRAAWPSDDVGARAGHTGGNPDKLEAIPGFRTGLSLAEAKAR